MSTTHAEGGNGITNDTPGRRAARDLFDRQLSRVGSIWRRVEKALDGADHIPSAYEFAPNLLRAARAATIEDLARISEREHVVFTIGPGAVVSAKPHQGMPPKGAF